MGKELIPLAVFGFSVCIIAAVLFTLAVAKIEKKKVN